MRRPGPQIRTVRSWCNQLRVIVVIYLVKRGLCNAANFLKRRRGWAQLVFINKQIDRKKEVVEKLQKEYQSTGVVEY